VDETIIPGPLMRWKMPNVAVVAVAAAAMLLVTAETVLAGGGGGGGSGGGEGRGDSVMCVAYIYINTTAMARAMESYIL